MDACRYVVTGASGFVGRRLAAFLDGAWEGLALAAPAWERHLEGAQFAGAVVIHLAGRAHARGTAEDFRRDNVEKTRALAESAARAGARRFVFLSSVKVNGETTTGRAFTPADAPAPEDDYGRSKRDAEAALHDVARGSSMQCVVVRSALVYGPPAKGHLATLLRVADSPLPLPFASVRNRRSFIALDDLCRAIVRCAQVEEAAGKTYLVANRSAVSTPQLIASVRRALGRPPRLYPMAPQLLERAAAVCGLGSRMTRLTRSLEVDPSLAEHDLQWTAQVSIDEALAGMVAAYRA